MRTKTDTRRALNLAAAAFMGAGLVVAPATLPISTTVIPTASATCPDVELIFARGRQEPPGAGQIGDALANALRPQVGGTLAVYGVNYPADVDTTSGAQDIANHVESMADNCPNTRMVIGGYSLGATAADLAVRTGISPSDSQHVAAVALFGNATHHFGPTALFAGKTIDQCANGDPICGNGVIWDSHLQPSYLGSGLVEQAAGFAAGRI